MHVCNGREQWKSSWNTSVGYEINRFPFFLLRPNRSIIWRKTQNGSIRGCPCPIKEITALVGAINLFSFMWCHRLYLSSFAHLSLRVFVCISVCVCVYVCTRVCVYFLTYSVTYNSIIIIVLIIIITMINLFAVLPPPMLSCGLTNFVLLFVKITLRWWCAWQFLAGRINRQVCLWYG